MNDTATADAPAKRGGLRELRRRAHLAWIVCAVVVFTISGSLVHLAWRDHREFHWRASQTVHLLGASTGDRLEFVLEQLAGNLERHADQIIDAGSGPVATRGDRITRLLHLLPSLTGIAVIGGHGDILSSMGPEAPTQTTAGRLLATLEAQGAAPGAIRYSIVNGPEWHGEMRVLMGLSIAGAGTGPEIAVFGVIDPEIISSIFENVSGRIGQTNFDMRLANAALYRADGEYFIPLGDNGESAPAPSVTGAVWSWPERLADGIGEVFEVADVVISRRPVARGDLVLLAWRPNGAFAPSWVRANFGYLGLSIGAMVVVILFTVFAMQHIIHSERAERALHERDRRIRSVMDNMVDGVITIDETGVIESFNRSAETIFGYAAEEMIGRNVSMLVPEPHRDRHDGYLQRHRETGESAILGAGPREVAALRKDGSTFPMELLIADMHVDGRRIFIGSVRDISRRRSAERALSRSERRLAEAHRIARLGSWELEVETDRLEWSEEAFRILGLPSEGVEPTTQLFYDYVHPEDAGLVRQLMRAAIAEDYPYRIQHRIIRPDGSVRTVHSEAVVDRDENGRATRLHGTVQDITERAEAEASLRESRARLAHAQRLAGFGHCLWDDAEQRLAYCSIEVADLFGVPRREFPRTRADLMALIDPADRERLRSAIGQARSREHIYEVEYAIVRPDGERRSVVEIGEVVVDAAGWIERTVSTFQDVTDRKAVIEELRAAKEEAELASRAKSEFLANMSHELRTPLNAIIGFSDMILGAFFGPVGSPKYLEYSQSIKDSGSHLLEIINDILDLSKIETSTVELDEEELDVGRVIRSCLTFVKERASVGRLTLDVDIAADAPLLRADERMVKQILLNLLSNAVKFTPAGGKVRVEARAAPDSGYELRVIDTGIGMAPDDVPKALMPFAQVDSGLTRKYEGTGLGLPLTKALVELHGGGIKIDSEEAAGTRVTIHFPPSRIASAMARPERTDKRA